MVDSVRFSSDFSYVILTASMEKNTDRSSSVRPGSGWSDPASASVGPRGSVRCCREPISRSNQVRENVEELVFTLYDNLEGIEEQTFTKKISFILFFEESVYQMRKAILISELNEFKEGELLIEQGAAGRSMYLILSGQVEVVRRSGSKAVRVAVMKSGQIFGEVGYIKETQRTAVRALTPVEALRFDYKKLKNDLKSFPHIVANINFSISCILGERLAEVYDIMDKQERQQKKEKSDHPESSGDTEYLLQGEPARTDFYQVFFPLREITDADRHLRFEN